MLERGLSDIEFVFRCHKYSPGPCFGRLARASTESLFLVEVNHLHGVAQQKKSILEGKWGKRQ
jgi:hypothetical protein